MDVTTLEEQVRDYTEAIREHQRSIAELTRKRNDCFHTLRDHGKTMREIGTLAGVSVSRVFKLLASSLPPGVTPAKD